MVAAAITRFTVEDPMHGHVPCVEVSAGSSQRELPVCLYLYGGSGSAETLVQLAPWLDASWQSGALPACRVVTPDVGPFSFYLDDAARGYGWESFIAQRLLDRVAPRPQRVGMVGTSMGGYGALKLAFTHAERICAVAANAPMLEPSEDARAVPARNRYHYPSAVPEALLGPERDPELFAADHPCRRARLQRDHIVAQQLAIYVDAGSDDALNAHDGAEYLHRVLWELDIVHEYHLLAHADHVGPSMLPRLAACFAWVLSRVMGRMQPTAASLSELELTWAAWLDAGGAGGAPKGLPALPATSSLMPRVLRAQLAPLRSAAEALDPSVRRHYGALPAKLAL